MLRSVAALAAPALLIRCAPLREAGLARDPFALGVASGYPTPDGMTLWTRLAPEPIGGGGMNPSPVAVAWEAAEDERFARIAARGVVRAEPAEAHAVHVDVQGLAPGRRYFYRFMAGEAVSPTGRASTAPGPDAAVGRLRFAVASCQHYEAGFYAAYRHMAAEDPDLVVHLGDYIYETPRRLDRPRRHHGPEPVDLAGYRDRHALYKTDRDLQAAHAACSWLAVWDDHEVANDYADDRSEDLAPREAFLARRAAAYRAYWEHMPLPARMRPTGPTMRIFDRAAFGDLAVFHLLDDRQYRSHQACVAPGRGGSGTAEDDCVERLDPARTMLGREQETWFEAGLAASPARWNVLAQQTLMAQYDREPGPGKTVWTDGWDGYPAARRRLIEAIAQRRPANPLVLGGDVHAFYVADLKPDFDDPRAAVVATEFVGTSITSPGPARSTTEAIQAENPHYRYVRGDRRGYMSIELDRRRAMVSLKGVDDATRPDSGIATLARFVVEDGTPGAQALTTN